MGVEDSSSISKRVSRNGGNLRFRGSGQGQSRDSCTSQVVKSKTADFGIAANPAPGCSEGIACPTELRDMWEANYFRQSRYEGCEAIRRSIRDTP